MQLLAIIVLLDCISGVLLKSCFNNHCDYHSELLSCVSGQYLCDSGEFCESETFMYHEHGNSVWTTSQCRPNTQIYQCWTQQAANSPVCDPRHAGHVCHYCCIDQACMMQLAHGAIPTNPLLNPATPRPTTKAPPVTSSPVTQAVVTSSVGTIAPTTPVPPVSSTGVDNSNLTTDPGECVDQYLGDCLADFGLDRCTETLVQKLCVKTCDICRALELGLIGRR